MTSGRALRSSPVHGRGTTADGMWLEGPDGRTIGAWLSRAAEPDDTAVLILPPLGYAASTSHRALRNLAEAAQRAGATALRIDYPGNGDSAGAAGDVESFAELERAARRGLAYLRQRGARRIVAIGCQVGATVAEAVTDDPAVTGVVLIRPQPGGRLVRSLRMIGEATPDGEDLSVGGHLLRGELLTSIRAAAPVVPDDVPTLVVDAADLVGTFLDRPAEVSTVGAEFVRTVTEWVVGEGLEGRRLAPAQPPADTVTATTELTLTEGDAGVVEQMVTVGGLAGILTTPGEPTAQDHIYVLLNSGSDPHPGPGGAWTELARHLAARGHAVLRVDFRGWGESPDGPNVPGRPFDPHIFEDLHHLVLALRPEWGAVILGGLCAGSWVALHAHRYSPIAGAVVLNAPLQYRFGDPYTIGTQDQDSPTRPELNRIKELGAEYWDREDAAGVRGDGGWLLDELVAADCPVSLVYAEDDEGLEYATHRLRRRLGEATATGVIRRVTVPGIDHSMQKTWFRPRLFDVVEKELRRVAGHPRRPGR